jgi:magnesium and cobalt transporter
MKNPQKTQSHSLLYHLRKKFSTTPKTIEEFIILIRDAEAHSLINVDALNMMEGVIQISEMQVREIMVPRSEMVTLKKTQTLDEILPIILQSGHSRFPVEGDNQEDIVGVLLAKDLLSYQVGDKKFDIDEHLRPVVFSPESKRLDILLKELRNAKNHMAIIADEYGGISGLVTMEDIVEQIVGEIEDEYDLNDEAFIKKHTEKEFIVKGITPIETFNQYFNTHYSDEECDTVAGLLIKEFGYLPKRNETIELNQFKLTILRCDKRRILLVGIEIR